MTCRECWDEPCTCEPQPLRDFENGYCTELAPRWPTPADWSDRANAWPFNADMYLRARFADFNERNADILMRESPVMMRLRLGESARPFVEPGSKLSRLLPDNRGLQRVVFDELANFTPPKLVLHPAQYSKLVGLPWPVKWCDAAELVELYPERPKGNRATRRARKAMARRR